MGSPQEAYAKLTVPESPICCTDASNLRLGSEIFEKSLIWDSQHRLWIEKDKHRSFWDVVIRTEEGHQILCSRKDLAGFSPFFLAMFSNEDYQEAHAKDLPLRDTCGKDFEVLLALHYSKEKAPLTASNILDVYALAERYRFNSAIDICQQIMAENLHLCNVFKVLRLKHTLGAYGAKCAEPFLRYAASTSSVMSDLKELCELPVEILADILRRGDICLSSEGEVLEVIKAWCLKENSRSGNPCGEGSAAPIPETLWKCLWLHVVDEVFLAKLLDDKTLDLTASQLREIGKALVFRKDPSKLFWQVLWKTDVDLMLSLKVLGQIRRPNGNEEAPTIFSGPEVGLIDIQLRRLCEGEFIKPACLVGNFMAVPFERTNPKATVSAEFRIENGISNELDDFEDFRICIVLNSSSLAQIRG